MIHHTKLALLAAILATTAFVSLAPALAQQAAPADKTTIGRQKRLGPSQEAAKSDRRSLQFPFPGQHEFRRGTAHGAQEILNVQPVIPFHVSDDWNIITRTILPLVWNPDMSPLPSTAFGTAPTTFSAFLSPRNPTNGWLWGVGPVVQIPTATSPRSVPASGAAAPPASSFT